MVARQRRGRPRALAAAVARRHRRRVPRRVRHRHSGRTGVQTPQAAVDLARRRWRCRGLHFEGLMTFPVRVPERRVLRGGARAVQRAPASRSSGLRRRHAGHLHASTRSRCCTEHRAGTYVYNDRRDRRSAPRRWEDCAMRVRATVVSRPTGERGVLDCGTKVLTSDLYDRRPGHHGHVMEYPEARDPRTSRRSTATSTSRAARAGPRWARWSRRAEPRVRLHEPARRGRRAPRRPSRRSLAGHRARQASLTRNATMRRNLMTPEATSRRARPRAAGPQPGRRRLRRRRHRRQHRLRLGARALP